MRLLIPKRVAFIEPEAPVFFLGGPIRGADDWQCPATIYLADRVPNAYIVNPCRYGPEHKLFPSALPGFSQDEARQLGIPEFTRQTFWERHYLSFASERGCIVFWLPKESAANPRKREDGPYGRDTYGELGEWRVWKLFERGNVVVGGEPGFSGLDVIAANFRAIHGGQFPIYSTLPDTLDAAIAAAKQHPS